MTSYVFIFCRKYAIKKVRDGLISLPPRIKPTRRHGDSCTDDRRCREKRESPNRKTQKAEIKNEIEDDGGLRILVKSGRFMKEEQTTLGNIHGWNVPGLSDVGFI